MISNKGFNKEFLFQFILITIVVLLFGYNARDENFNLSQFVFALNYCLAALFIGYFLLPKFFYNKKYILFILAMLGVLIVSLLIEEFILEKIFYPDTKGKRFGRFIPSLLDVLPVSLIVVGFKFAWDANKKQNELNQLHQIVADSQSQFLKSQINPHFLFNNLNNIYSFALNNSPRTPDIILQLSSILRYMLYECQKKKVSLESELKCIRDFFQLQELQIEDRGSVNLNIEGNPNAYKIDPLILIVFIENCFKHSASSVVDNIKIDVDIKIANDKLIMTCTNTHSSDANNEKLDKGIGLKNVKTRLDLSYPDQHMLEISDDGELYKVFLEIDLENK